MTKNYLNNLDFHGIVKLRYVVNFVCQLRVICVITYHSQCVVHLLFVTQNDLRRNGLIEPRLFRENSNCVSHYAWALVSGSARTS